MATSQNNFVVRLIPFVAYSFGTAQSIADSQVSFDVTPSFSESRNVEYAQVIPVHMPGGMQIYKRTNSRTFTIGAHFISRSVADAVVNMTNLQKLRGWTLPYFGMTDTIQTTQLRAQDAQFNTQQNNGLSSRMLTANYDQQTLNRIADEGVQLRGAPPDLLYLYAYSTSSNDIRNPGKLTNVNLNRIPVVITNLDITYPEDVDYIPVYQTDPGISEYAEPFPIKMDVTVQLMETHSPLEYQSFDLSAYKLGNLQNF